MIALALVMLVTPAQQLRGPPPFGRAAGGPTACSLPGVVSGRPVPEAVRRGVAKGVRSVRIMRPGDQSTMDLVPERRNVHVDAAGIVTHVTCG